MYKKRSNVLLAMKIALAVIVFLLVAALVTVIIINRNNLTLENVKETIVSIWKKDDEAGEFTFNMGSNGVLSCMDGGVAAASSVGIQVFNNSGEETLMYSLNMENPVLSCSGGSGVGYDVGGYKLCVFSAEGQKYALEMNEKIISANVNDSAWLALCTQESGYAGLVAVYNEKGNAVYKWYSGTAYVPFAAVSQNCDYMAALTLNESGGRLVCFKLDSEDELYSLELSGETPLGIRFSDNNTVTVITDKRVITTGKDGEIISEYDLSGKHINSFSLSGDGFTYLVYGNYQVDTQRNIITFDKNGGLLGELQVADDMTDISAGGKYIAVLYKGHLTVYNSDLSEYANMEYSDSGSNVLARGDGNAIVIFEHTATVVRPADGEES